MAFIRSIILICILEICFVGISYGGNFYKDVDITWGDGRAKINRSGNQLTLSLDKFEGSGFQSKNNYLFGRFDMQIKLVKGNSAGTVTAYYVSYLSSFIHILVYNARFLASTYINIRYLKK